ncbi:hypothetical protein PF005_g25265 [Phytophthora fragariae]|uniref:Uncharacterized protein n=1 Tax=Phytophthora fragariae TaxID=53985 RepID=A0A6A4BZY9_9STRA|nr:hypothetical protein PF003_g18543 [Phytophthora fragariae]KAE8923696.1 hypothetical protein PF009_g26058 [Phytophthora fragariae]KAE9175753.1 hypothetical protein PF005_g25265 [Phytophthora fragariae]KAE9282514.1 hypothetical protein PF001_g23272 [Phytophthora fragariae]
MAGPDLDDGDDSQEFSVPIDTLQLRTVDADEANLWPGTYLGHPVAFIRPSGPKTGLWTYGVATRYEFLTDGPYLTIISGAEVVELKLHDPPRAIKADPITYALQVGASVSDMAVNPKELLRQQNAVIGACRTRRNNGSELPTAVHATLTVPFIPDEIVPLVGPHDPSVMYVRRQHILDCLRGSRKKSKLDMYRDPQASHSSVDANTSPPQAEALLRPDESMSTSSDDDIEDVKAIRQQNRTLGKRSRRSDTEIQDSQFFDDSSITEADGISDDEVEPRRGAFRPTATQQRVHRSISHARFKADMWDRAHAHESNVSLTDFSERNSLRAATPATSRSDVCSALRALRVFGLHFHNQDVIDIIDSALNFTDRYRGVPDTDALGWKMMAFWITTKFSKFRSFLVLRDMDSARLVGGEFSRTDEDLLELRDLRRSRRTGDQGGLRPRQTPDSSRRAERPRRESSVPANVLAALPVQGTKKLCMKSISQAGCSGNGSGGCFDFKRAHFKPTSLPDIVKTYITESYKGLASSCQDL